MNPGSCSLWPRRFRAMPRAAILGLAAMAALANAEPRWSRLPPLPDREGFAAMFAGATDAGLMAAGGANFPDRRPWEGGAKRWYDDVWLLPRPDGGWRRIGQLPGPLAYGAGLSTGHSLLCIGGSDERRHHAECFLLGWRGGALETRPFAPLPRPCANLCAAIVGSRVFVAGGTETPDATEAMATFWSHDLEDPAAPWTELPAWPGKGRMLAVAGALGDAFYLFGGAALHAGAGGKPEREWLRDAHRYTTAGGWVKLPDLPRAAVAAPSPAPASAAGLLVIGGDDGGRVGFKPETGHPGFPRDILLFNPAAGRWSAEGTAPFSRATVPVALWRGRFVLPGGEVRPGYRSPEVWELAWP